MAQVKTESSWRDVEVPKYGSLTRDLTCDVAIIGGGLAGVLTAYLLAKEGKAVVLLEKDHLGSGATGATTAMLTASIDTDAADLISAYGEKDARTLIVAHQDAIELFERIIKEEGIDCDWQRVSNIIYANTDDDIHAVEEEYANLKKLGIDVARSDEWPALGFKNAGFVEFEDQALFHPLKFLFALAAITEQKYGAHIFDESEVTAMRKDGEMMRLDTKQHYVTALWAVSATYEPFHQPFALYLKKGMYVTYMFELLVKGMKLREGSYEDTYNPYHFGRIEKEKDGYRFIIGGEDHRKDFHTDPNKSWNALKDYVDSILPEDSYEIRRRWRGPILEPIDGIPLIGALNDDPVLYISAFSGNGMTYSAIAAQIIVDHINGRKNDLERLYSPKRITHLKSFLRKAVDYAAEIGGGAIKNTFTESKELDSKIKNG